MLKTRLYKISEDFLEDGIEGILNQTPETFLDLETLLNEEINTATDKELQHYIELRYLFRILLKYGGDMQQGLNQLIIYNE